MKSQGIHVGLTGAMGSGKGEVLKLLQARGFRPISLSDLVRKEARKADPAADRSRLQDIGNRLREEHGPGALGRMVRDEIQTVPPARWVIDGIRNPSEVSELRKLPNFSLVGVSAPRRLLIDRIRRRKRRTDTAAHRDLIRRLEREWGTGEKAEGQQVGACMANADFRVSNDGSIAMLANRVDNILFTILEKEK